MRGLPVIGSTEARVLVLGSFPSAESLRKGEYYGFGRNHFWTVLARAFGEPEFISYADKLDFLARRGIAIWDVLGACDREGSLDQAIRNEKPNPIPGFLEGRPTIVRIALNGGKAAASFFRHFSPGNRPPVASVGASFSWCHPGLAGRAFAVARLPSTSPIPTRAFRSADDKVEAWRLFLVGA